MSANKKKTEETSLPDFERPIDPEELIRVSDFESMKVTVEVQNTTTRTEVANSALVELLEIVDRGVVLSVPIRTCARGHSLMIRMIGTTPSKEQFDFLSTAKVDRIQPIEDSHQDRITITFIQYDETGWERFCEKFSNRQEQIENFLKAAKGL